MGERPAVSWWMCGLTYPAQRAVVNLDIVRAPLGGIPSRFVRSQYEPD